MQLIAQGHSKQRGICCSEVGFHKQLNINYGNCRHVRVAAVLLGRFTGNRLLELLQLEAVVEGFEADFLDAVEFVQALVFDEGGGQLGVHLGAIVLDLIGAGLDEADQVGHFGGVADGDIGVVGFGDDEGVDAAGTVGIVAEFGAVQGAAQANVHRALIGVIQDIGLGEMVQLPVAKLDGDDFGVGLPDGGEVVDAVQDGTDVVELLHDFHEEGVFVLEERDAGGVRGEGSEFVAQHIGQAGARNRNGVAVLDEHRTCDGKIYDLIVVYVFVQDVQQDLVGRMARRVCDSVVVFGVGFRDAGAGNAFNLLGAGETILLAELAQVLCDVGARRADDININGESPGGVQVEHQGRTAFEDEGAAGTDKGFQQGEGADGFLYKGCVGYSGDMLLCLLNPFQASASGVNHG